MTKRHERTVFLLQHPGGDSRGGLCAVHSDALKGEGVARGVGTVVRRANDSRGVGIQDRGAVLVKVPIDSVFGSEHICIAFPGAEDQIVEFILR